MNKRMKVQFINSQEFQDKKFELYYPIGNGE